MIVYGKSGELEVPTYLYTRHRQLWNRLLITKNGELILFSISDKAVTPEEVNVLIPSVQCVRYIKGRGNIVTVFSYSGDELVHERGLSYVWGFGGQFKVKSPTGLTVIAAVKQDELFNLTRHLNVHPLSRYSVEDNRLELLYLERHIKLAKHLLNTYINEPVWQDLYCDGEGRLVLFTMDECFVCPDESTLLSPIPDWSREALTVVRTMSTSLSYSDGFFRLGRPTECLCTREYQDTMPTLYRVSAFV